MTKFNRKKVVEMLESGVRKIEFTKTNGENRIMNATLMEDVITPMLKGIGNNINDKDIVAVVDTDLNKWRSFRLSNLKSIA